MGIRKRNIIKDVAVEHLVSNIKISKAKCCYNCPLKLYAGEDEKIVFGVGNIITDTIMILPDYDFKAKIGYINLLYYLEKTYRNITNNDIFENYYITRTIKCNNKSSFDIKRNCLKYCASNLEYEINRINPKKIIIFDKDIHDLILYKYNRNEFNIKTVISPGVMYYNNDILINRFIEQFTNAIFSNDS